MVPECLMALINEIFYFSESLNFLLIVQKVNCFLRESFIGSDEMLLVFLSFENEN